MPIWEYVETTERSPEEIARLQEDLGAALREAVGEQWVTMDPLILDTHAWHYLAQAASSSNCIERPLAVVLPATTAEVAAMLPRDRAYCARRLPTMIVSSDGRQQVAAIVSSLRQFESHAVNLVHSVRPDDAHVFDEGGLRIV